ncbi:MAG TPA: hypothetical protein ENJ18_17575 [Nannocystis exedens]|nr:hypothetical protein [Nannocystis exedens]
MIDDLDDLLSDDGAEKLRLLGVSRNAPENAAQRSRLPGIRPPARPPPQDPATDEELDSGIPVLAVLSTPHDDVKAWLIAGETLARVLLRGRVDHLWASFLGQVIEVPSARATLHERLGADAWPQVVLRLGYAGDLAPTPRRALSCQLRETPPKKPAT